MVKSAGILSATRDKCKTIQRLDARCDGARPARRCAWDRAQTRETLRPYLVEEVLELDHALGEGEPDAIRASSATSCSTWPFSS